MFQLLQESSTRFIIKNKKNLLTEKRFITVNHYIMLVMNILHFMNVTVRGYMGLIYRMLQKLMTMLLEVVTKYNTSNYIKFKD